jgi:broad specificity phosphatase PhoE
VYDRVTSFRETLRNDINFGRFNCDELGCRTDDCTVVIVTHGLTLRVFLMRWGGASWNSVDPWLETAWFQTLTLEYQSWFQNVPFKFNLRHYNAVVQVDGGNVRAAA